jgi:uncharacterized protein DUF5985
MQFLLGSTVMSAAVAALFFLRFFVRTRDRLFLMFAAAFALLAIGWIAQAISGRSEAHPELYLIRLAAFVLIIIAIVDKNRAARRRDSRK